MNTESTEHIEYVSVYHIHTNKHACYTACGCGLVASGVMVGSPMLSVVTAEERGEKEDVNM